MALDWLAAFFVALGIFMLYFSIRAPHVDKQNIKIVILGTVLVIAGIYALLSGNGSLIREKLKGLVLAYMGFVLVVKVPYYTSYQPKAYATLSIFAGLFLLVFGIYSLIF